MIIRRNILTVWKLARKNILTCMFWASIRCSLPVTPFVSADTPSLFILYVSWRLEVHEDSGAVVCFLSIPWTTRWRTVVTVPFFSHSVLFSHWFEGEKSNHGLVFTVMDLLLFLWMLFALNKMNVAKQISSSEGDEKEPWYIFWYVLIVCRHQLEDWRLERNKRNDQ